MGSRDQGADATKNRWLTIPRTLCFVTYDDDILLMKRAAHRRVFPNKYNGLGGHIERHETPLSGAIREIREEAGLDVEDVILRGIHHIDTEAETGILLFVYTATATSRDFIDPGEEGTLHWIKQNDVLSLELVEDLPVIIPQVLSMGDHEPPYYAHISYDTHDKIQIRFTEITL
jgi:8-oxo-dGTP diphosphatase